MPSSTQTTEKESERNRMLKKVKYSKERKKQ